MGWHGARCEGGEGSKKSCFSCTYQNCIADCGGGSGVCNKIAGECTCEAEPGQFFNGATCKKACKSQTYVADSSRSFDKWGWSTCKDNHLLTGLKRDGAGDALYNLAYGKCARPCEGDPSSPKDLRLEHCYHENWWKKFDFKGGKLCRKNYVVAGLFRSHCNSLYCLEMAKCCQVKKSLWTACKWVSKTGWTGRKNGIKANNKDGFVVGFWRDSKHTLNGLTELRICTPIWWGLFTQEAVR